MPIPLLDLNAQYASIKEEVNAAIQEVLESQQFIMGETVRDFESEIAKYIGVDYAYGCASGSDALLLALMALDIGPGDYVITSPFTFFATGGAISRLGAFPIFIDIDPGTYTLDPVKLSALLKGESPLAERLNLSARDIKAIIPVHLYGQMADMDPIMKLAKEYNLRVIEDAAQAIGSTYQGRAAGTFGDFGCFSFFPSKNLGAYGDAGLITVKDPALAEKVNILRLHGAKPKYHHSLVGINSRLDTIQAAILRVKLGYLEEWTAQRIGVAQRYRQLFTEAGIVTEDWECCSGSCKESGGDECSLTEEQVLLPVERSGTNHRHVYHQYTIRVKNRDSLVKHLKKHGIGNAVYYPIPLHTQQCFSELGYTEKDCPAAICASKQVLSLPMYPQMKEEQIREVVEAVAGFIKR